MKAAASIEPVTGGVNVSRRYHSPLRAEQARETRQRILAAARELFLQGGYAGTTVVAVAEAAGVSPDTIYGSLGGKRGLLEGVAAAAMPDPGDEGQLEQQRAAADIDAISDPRQRLRRMVERSCRRLARTSPVHAIIRSADEGDGFTGRLKTTMLKRRLEYQARNVRAHLGAALRPALTPEDACQRYSALACPELYHLVTVEMAWPPERFEAWLIDLLTADLLGQVPEGHTAATRAPASSDQ